MDQMKSDPPWPADPIEIAYLTDALQKRIDECAKTSTYLRGTACVCLIVDFLCAGKENRFVIILTLAAVAIFFAIDVVLLRKKQRCQLEYETTLNQIRKETQTETAVEVQGIRYPIVFYLVIAVVMIALFFYHSLA